MCEEEEEEFDVQLVFEKDELGLGGEVGEEVVEGISGVSDLVSFVVIKF